MTTCWGAAPPAAYWADSTATCSSSEPSLGPLSGGSPGNKRRRYCNFNEKQVQVTFPSPVQSYSIVAALLFFNIQNCTALALSLAQQKTLSIRDNRQTKHTPAIREWNGSRWALFDKKAESERHFIHPFFSNTYVANLLWSSSAAASSTSSHVVFYLLCISSPTPPPPHRLFRWFCRRTERLSSLFFICPCAASFWLTGGEKQKPKNGFTREIKFIRFSWSRSSRRRRGGHWHWVIAIFTLLVMGVPNGDR